MQFFDLAVLPERDRLFHGLRAGLVGTADQPPFQSGDPPQAASARGAAAADAEPDLEGVLVPGLPALEDGLAGLVATVDVGAAPVLQGTLEALLGRRQGRAEQQRAQSDAPRQSALQGKVNLRSILSRASGLRDARTF